MQNFNKNEINPLRSENINYVIGVSHNAINATKTVAKHTCFTANYS